MLLLTSTSDVVRIVTASAVSTITVDASYLDNASGTITHFGIGSDSTTAGNLFFKGALGASLAVSSGITPSFAIGELDVNLD